MFAQIPGGSGLYPIEMTSGFFRSIYPYLPFSYGIDALRAAMMGVYQNDFWIAMGHLALFIIPFLLLGLVLRKPISRFMKLYVSKVEECKIVE